MSSDQLNRFRGNLTVIAECYALLAGQHHAAATGKPGARVSSTPEPRLPIAVDAVDLTAASHPATLQVATLTPWPEDQTGHLAVATELDRPARNIAHALGDKPPVPTVPNLATWLHERAGWAWDYYEQIDHLVITVDRIARTLYAVTNPDRPEKAEPRTAPCPGCGEATLTALGGRVTCSMDDCGRVLTEDEYTTWARETIVRETLGGPGMSAAAIAIKYQRSKESVHWLAHKHGWTKTDGTQRPVLYLGTDVETTMTQIAARKTRRAA